MCTITLELGPLIEVTDIHAKLSDSYMFVSEFILLLIMCVNVLDVYEASNYPQTPAENATLLEMVQPLCVLAFGFLQFASCSLVLAQVMFFRSTWLR
jgi:hypothetical protein